jgi:small nuclear ribonucleoprotein (snRNP)-like protein
MDLISYINNEVYIILTNKYYYKGKVIQADQSSLTLIDKNNQKVSISKDSISSIREIKYNGGIID